MGLTTKIDNNKGTIYSEGETLNVTIFLESSEEFSIFKTKIIPEKGYKQNSCCLGT